MDFRVLQEALEDKSSAASGSDRLSSYKSRPAPKNQEDRRRQILENHKKFREEAFQKLRGFADEGSEKERNRNYVCKRYCDILMLSEWLEDIPDELEEEWYTTICPKGKRCLVVASMGKTTAYSRSGWFLASHPSYLPRGQRHSQSGGRAHGSLTLLDCIYSETMQTYFVLDVLMWNGHAVAECDTEFRFVWLASKLEETKGLDRPSKVNPYPFIAAPSFPYVAETLGQQLSSLEKKWGAENVDGLLFYHRKIPYIAGPTPLVGWLKPYMLPERLNMHVSASLLASIPKDYVNFAEHLKRHSDDYKKERNSREQKAKSTLQSIDSWMDDNEDLQTSPQVAACSFSQWR